MRYTVKVNATLNGKTCKNPQVEFIQGEDLIFPCEIKPNEITFELKPGSDPNACIEGYIKCEDDCLNCPPQYFKVCLCNDVTALEACQICKDGFIQDLCSPEDIANGKICTPDGCNCPPTAPIQDPATGQCVQCITGEKKDCKICVGGFWEDIVCPEGEVCISGECSCPFGFVRNPFTGLCEPAPTCIDDSDCGVCETCVNGNCEPVKCPQGLQCINGECVPECANKTCTNGADCGENCGCLNGECVPCSILSCLDEASCAAALGCECSNGNCGPIDNCLDYCDGNTPCIDPNCTCYNNKCVNCKNFPCNPDECSDKPNCGCSDGDCGGGKPCEDELTLTKKEDCTKPEGCELKATLTVKNGCNCDPIEFRTKDVKPTTDQDSGTMLLEIKMYKNNQPYSNYKNIDIFGDNELVSGQIKIVATSVAANQAPSVAVATKTITDNKIGDNTTVAETIAIGSSLIKKIINGVGTKVTINVYAENIEVKNSGCIKYSTQSPIATYELDYTSTNAEAATLNKIKGVYRNVISRIVTDNISEKKPLFVWYKSTTGDFSGKFDNTTSTYNKKGWFRKNYGTKVGASWVDFINKPEQGLVNNYNYKVSVDCGCKTTQTEEKLLFCCTPTLNQLTSCNQSLVIPPFKVCAVNGKLTDSATIKYPPQVQTKYKVNLTLADGTQVSDFIQFNGNTSIEYTKNVVGNPVKSGYISQYYEPGGLLSQEECRKDFTVIDQTVQNPNVNYKLNCNFSSSQFALYVQNTSPVTITKYSVTFKGPDLPNGAIILTKNNPVFEDYTALPNSNLLVTDKTYMSSASGGIFLTVYFSNGCVSVIEIPKCNNLVDIDTVPPNAKSNINCPNGGSGVLLEANTSFFDNTLPINYTLVGGSINQQKTDGPSTQFQNIPAGTYVLTATQGSLTATDTITVEDNLTPTVALSPANICIGQSSTLTIGALEGTTFNVTAPNGTLIANNLATGPTNTIVLQNLTLAGNYTVVLVSDPTNSYCSFSTVVTLEVGGETVSPTIEVQPGSYCVGQPIPFRILDGGVNLTYNVSSNGTGNITSPLQASNGAYNGLFTPNGLTGIIAIPSSNDGCNVINATQVNLPASGITITQGATITNAVAVCQPNNQHTVNVTVSGTPTAVTIGGVAATPVGGGVYTRTNIQGLTEVQIVVTTGTCIVQQTLPLQNCLCPTGEVFIDSDGDTCGQGTSNMTYNGTTLPIDNTWQYVWQSFTGGQWVDLGATQNFALPTLPTISINTQVGINETRRLRVINPTNGCIYYSNDEFVTAVNPPIGVTINQSPSGTVQVNTPVTFSTQQGYFSYQWGGAATGTTYQSNPVTFTTAGTYNITLQVCNAAGCCTTVTSTITVVSNCNLTLNPISDFTNSCVNTVTVNGSGGSGARTYEIVSTYINVPAGTPVTPGIGSTFTIPINTSLVPPNISDLIVITVSDSSSPACTQTVSFNYERCNVTDVINITSITPNGCVNSSIIKFSVNGNRILACRPSGYTLYYKYEVTNVPYGGSDTYTFQYDTGSGSFFKQTLTELDCNPISAPFSLILNHPQVNLSTFGGDTVDIEVWAYSDPALTSLVANYTETGLVMPLTCP